MKTEGYSLTYLLEIAKLPESTYHYHVSRMRQPDKDKELKTLIQEIFTEHQERYGYRRIRDELRSRGYHVNHKRVWRLMKEIGLQCIKFKRRTRRYNSYKGEVGKTAKNRLNRHFTTPIPLQKLATDVTEFKCLHDKKLYLSPIMDLYNREIISYKLSESATLDIALDPLTEALSIVQKYARYRTTIHSDQGWHYQNYAWIHLLKKHRIFQSMSHKGNCLDNSPMENFFGILKQEMYYGEELVDQATLKQRIERYIQYYNHRRIKTTLSGLSPVNFRKQDTQFAN